MNKRRLDQRGFTLMEIMIVLAILGVLVAIAVPSMTYQVSRSQISRVHSELSHYRNPIEEILLEGGQSQLGADAKAAVNFVDSDMSSVVFGNFANVASSTITATLDERASSFIHGTTVTLSRDLNGTWTCTVVGAGGGWDEKLRPLACE